MCRPWMKYCLVVWICLLICTAHAKRKKDKKVRPKEKVACEGDRVNLSCPAGKKIHIVRAMYGRLVLSLCNERRVMTGWDLYCMSVRSTTIVVERCHGVASCELWVNNNVFSDPCPGTEKYLTVSYYCLAPEPTQPPTTTTLAPTTPEPTTPEVTSPAPIPVASTEIVVNPSGVQVGYCEARTERGIDWPRTKEAEQASQPCPQSDQGRAIWLCVRRKNKVKWKGSPDLSLCTSKFTSDLTAMMEMTSPAGVVKKVAEVTREETLVGGDLIATSNILHESISSFRAEMTNPNVGSIEKVVKAKEFSKALVESSSNMLDKKQEESWNDLGSQRRKTEVATTLLHSLERSAEEVAEVLDSPQTVKSEAQNIIVEINVIEASPRAHVSDQVFPKPPPIGQSAPETVKDQIRIPSRALKVGAHGGKVKVIFAVYDNLAQYMSPERSEGTESDQSLASERQGQDMTRKGTIVNSNIISASFVGARHPVAIPEPLEYTMRHNTTENVTNPRCAFWNFDPVKFTGEWSTVGCRLLVSNKTHTQCACDHMTNFAVLMDVVGVDLHIAHIISLQVITYAGCLVSIVCLFLCFLTFVCFRNLQSDRNTIHKNLVLTLLLAEVLFLTGIAQVQHPLLCSIIAGLLHLLFLCAFSWMCLEGIQLYMMLIEVFEAEKSRVKWYYLGGYGVPIIVVAVAAGVYPGGYGTANHCWLTTERGFIWSFVGPVMLVITVNVVMLSIAIYMMWKHANMSAAMKEKSRMGSISNDLSEASKRRSAIVKSRSAMTDLNRASSDLALTKSQSMNIMGQHQQSGLLSQARSNISVMSSRNDIPQKDANRPTVRAWIKSAWVLVILLGLTWAFGILYVNSETVVMAYIFTILNALQGLFIFIFHCLMNDKVQKEWKKCVRRTSWLPECVRVGYGGERVTHVSTTPSRSNSSAGNYFTRLLSGRRRKRSSTTSLPKSMIIKNNNANYDSYPDSGVHGSSVFHESDGSGKCVDIANIMNDRLQSPSATTGYNRTPVSLYLPAYGSKTDMLKQKAQNGYNGLVPTAPGKDYQLDLSVDDMCHSEYSDADLFKMTDYCDEPRGMKPQVSRIEEIDEGYDGYEVPLPVGRRDSQYEVPHHPNEDRTYHVLIPESELPKPIRDSGMVPDSPDSNDSPILNRGPSIPEAPEKADVSTSMGDLTSQSESSIDSCRKCRNQSASSVSNSDNNDVTMEEVLSPDSTLCKSEPDLSSEPNKDSVEVKPRNDLAADKDNLRSLPNLSYTNTAFEDYDGFTPFERRSLHRRSGSDPGNKVRLGRSANDDSEC